MSNRDQGSKRGNAKLDEDKVARARRLYLEGWSAGSLAALFGVTPTVMHFAIVGRTWRHVRNPPPVRKGLRPCYWRQKPC